MMTPNLTTEAFAALGAPDLVYVRPIKAAEIMASTPAAQIQGFQLDPDQILYAVHRADGERLAREQLVSDYQIADSDIEICHIEQ